MKIVFLNGGNAGQQISGDV